MTLRILQTIIVCMFALQIAVGTPHDLIRPGCFDPKYHHYPQWFRFPDERMDALERITNDPDGNTVACFGKPAEDRAGSLWNERYDNRVIPLGGGGDGLKREAGPYQGYDIWNLPEDVDYVYLNPEVDAEYVQWIADNPDGFSLVYLDQWGIIMEVIN